MERYVQALEEVFRKWASALETRAHFVQPRQGFLPVVIRKREILDVELQPFATPIRAPDGISQFVHPRSHQPAFQLEEDLVAARGCNS